VVMVSGAQGHEVAEIGASLLGVPLGDVVGVGQIGRPPAARLCL